MNYVLDSFASFTVFSFSIYIILRVVSRSYSVVFKNEQKYLQSSFVKNVKKHDLRRDMGSYETYRAELSSRYGNKIYAVVSFKSLITLRRHYIKNTLLLLAKKWPILQARTKSYLNAQSCAKREFIVNHEETFDPELRFVNTSNWKLVLEEELMVKNGRSDDKLCWNTIVLREQYEPREKMFINTVLFLFDPVIIDRISVVKFTEDFITMLCQLVNCDVHINTTRTSHLPVPTEEHLRQPFLLRIFSVLKQIIMSYACSPVSGQQKDKQWKLQSKPLIVMKSLSEEDTFRLLGYCGKLNCSLTALFLAAWSSVMSGRVGSNKALCHKKPITIVVDYRPLMETDLSQEYTISNCCSSLQLQLLSDQKKKKRHFGSSVGYYEDLLQSAIRKKKHLDLIWLPKYQRECFGRFSPLEIADIGSFSFRQTWPFSLHDIYIGASTTSTVNLTLLLMNNRLYCGMHLTSHFSGCANLLDALFARIVQKMSWRI